MKGEPPLETGAAAESPKQNEKFQLPALWKAREVKSALENGLVAAKGREDE
jgi:hypothetical protein